MRDAEPHRPRPGSEPPLQQLQHPWNDVLPSPDPIHRYHSARFIERQDRLHVQHPRDPRLPAGDPCRTEAGCRTGPPSAASPIVLRIRFSSGQCVLPSQPDSASSAPAGPAARPRATPSGCRPDARPRPRRRARPPVPRLIRARETPTRAGHRRLRRLPLAHPGSTRTNSAGVGWEVVGSSRADPQPPVELLRLQLDPVPEDLRRRRSPAAGPARCDAGRARHPTGRPSCR